MTLSDHDLSKFLSFVLRHAPMEIGISLDAGGWANVTGSY
jgi:putative RNA 2'-phosphotransferase